MGRAFVEDRRRARLVGDAEGAHRPPGLALPEGVHADVAEGAVGRCAEVDRGLTTARSGSPARAEELLARRHEVVGAGARPLRVEDDDRGAGRHHVDQQLHVIDEHRGQRLHALHRDPVGDLVGQLEQLGVRPAERRGATAYVLGEEELAARRRPQPLDQVERSLVGDGEGAQLLDVVAPELDPDRVLLGRREDVDDAAAHGELAPLLDQVDPACTPRPQGAPTRSSSGIVSPGWSSTGSRSPRPLTCGWSTDRTGATTTRTSPLAACLPGWRRRRRTASRRPTVSLRGLSRSCGSVSQLG